MICRFKDHESISIVIMLHLHLVLSITNTQLLQKLYNVIKKKDIFIFVGFWNRNFE